MWLCAINYWIAIDTKIQECYKRWEKESSARFERIRLNEQQLNQFFIDIYGLQDELTPEVEDKDVTVRKADLSRDIRSFISYAVGCMFGRYSLDEEGLIYAGGEWDSSRYKTFFPDDDNCIPIPIAPKIGCTPETLRVWVRQHERDTGYYLSKKFLTSSTP